MYTAQILKSHIAAKVLPDPSNGRLRDAALAVLSLAAALFQNRLLLGCPGDAALDKTADASVLHGDVAGRSNEIALFDAGQALFGRIVGKADIRPVQVGLVDRARDDLPDRNRILDLLQDEGGK